MWRLVGLVRIGVSKELVAGIFRVKRNRQVGKTLSVTSILVNATVVSSLFTFHPDDGDDTILQNVSSNNAHTAPHSRRRQFPFQQLFERGILMIVVPSNVTPWSLLDFIASHLRR
jgi:hypothetical protein